MDPMPPFPSGRDAARTWISKELKARRLTKAKSPGGYPKLSLLVGDDEMPLFPGVAGYRDLVYTGKACARISFGRLIGSGILTERDSIFVNKYPSLLQLQKPMRGRKLSRQGRLQGLHSFFFTTDATATTAWDSTAEANLLINNDGEFAAAASQEELQDAASAADILLRDKTDNVVSCIIY
jgi:hypothetical protein